MLKLLISMVKLLMQMLLGCQFVGALPEGTRRRAAVVQPRGEPAAQRCSATSAHIEIQQAAANVEARGVVLMMLCICYFYFGSFCAVSSILMRNTTAELVAHLIS